MTAFIENFDECVLAEQPFYIFYYLGYGLTLGYIQTELTYTHYLLP